MAKQQGASAPERPPAQAEAADERSRAPADSDAQARHRARRKRRLLTIGVPVLIVILAAGTAYYFLFLRGRQSTDDAYTDGRAIPVAPKVSGYVKQLAVDDNQAVADGQLLLQIDPRDFAQALAAARGQRQQAEARLAAAQLSLQVERIGRPADVQSAQAARDRAAAQLRKAQADYQRNREVDPRATTPARTDQIITALRNARAALTESEARLRTAQQGPRDIDIAESRVHELQGELQTAQAHEQQAILNLGYTQLRAPALARVTDRSVEQGQYVQVGQALMTLVSPQVWITANFKEGQLTHMRTGQPVQISVDAYPQLDLHGHVDSIQMGSGARFSAFPPENATGNFVKVVRRVPVKIIIDSGLPAGFELPLGLSVEPTVDER